MKTTFKYAASIVCILSGALIAQAEPGQEAKAQTTQDQSTVPSGSFDYDQARQYMDMTGRPCRDAHGRSIGRIDHIIATSPENGVAQVAIRGRNSYAMVPLASLSREQGRQGQTKAVKVNSTAKQIASAPKIALESWNQVDLTKPQFMQNLYAHYDLPGNTDTAVGSGGASGSSGTTTGSGSSISDSQQQQTQ